MTILLKPCIGDAVQNSGVREEPVQQLAGDSGEGVGAAYTASAPGDALVGFGWFGWVCVCVCGNRKWSCLSKDEILVVFVNWEHGTAPSASPQLNVTL